MFTVSIYREMLGLTTLRYRRSQYALLLVNLSDADGQGEERSFT
jgi:hypothetical protein